jgi:hypothetical protein
MIEAYKAEYDLLISTGLKHKQAVDKLHSQYTLEPEELTIANSWEIVTSTKKAPRAKRAATKVIVPEIVEPEIVEPPSIEEVETEREKIAQFKELALDHCLTFMRKDARYAEVKEFKDIVAVVDSIEKSYDKSKGTDTPTINILVQNLVERFRDDC